MHVEMVHIKLDAGRYYLGDPYHIFTGARWDAFFAYGYGDSYAVNIDGAMILTLQLPDGDGVYGDWHGETYAVDSGLLSLIPVAMVGLPAEALAQLGRVVEIGEDDRCYADFANGLYRIGPVTIVADRNLWDGRQSESDASDVDEQENEEMEAAR